MFSEDDVKRRWKNLRDQFRNELKKMPVGRSGDPGNFHESFSNWKHFKALLFLTDQIKCRPLTGNLKKRKAENDLMSKTFLKDGEETFYSIEIPEAESEEFAQIAEPSGTFEVSKGTLKTLTASKTELPAEISPNVRNPNKSEILAIEKRKLEILEHKQRTKNIRDEDEAFFDSLLPHMKKLKPSKKLLCRMDIENIVYKHVYSSPMETRSVSPMNYSPSFVEQSSDSTTAYTVSSSPSQCSLGEMSSTSLGSELVLQATESEESEQTANQNSNDFLQYYIKFDKTH